MFNTKFYASIGLGKRWDDLLPTLFADGCDLGRWRASASAAQRGTHGHRQGRQVPSSP